MGLVAGAVAEGVPGVTAQVKDVHGTWKGTSGVGDLKSGKPRGAHDDTVEKRLPGVVRG